MRTYKIKLINRAGRVFLKGTAQGRSIKDILERLSQSDLSCAHKIIVTRGL